VEMGGLNMKKSLAAVALAAALAQPASAITFPSLTTIYVGSGVRDNGAADIVGVATTFHCTNVSGVTVSIRYLVLFSTGAVAGAITRSAAHGATVTASTHDTALFSDTDNLIVPGTALSQGGINIEATESDVFCTAMMVDASAIVPSGIDLHLVRVNPHPGTVE
jgi:hypothetical protein